MKLFPFTFNLYCKVVQTGGHECPLLSEILLRLTSFIAKERKRSGAAYLIGTVEARTPISLYQEELDPGPQNVFMGERSWCEREVHDENYLLIIVAMLQEVTNVSTMS